MKVRLDFGSLRGQYSLQTASEVNSDLRFEISDPNYLLIHVHIAYILYGAIRQPLGPLQSQVKYELVFEINDFNYIRGGTILVCEVPYHYHRVFRLCMFRHIRSGISFNKVQTLQCCG